MWSIESNTEFTKQTLKGKKASDVAQLLPGRGLEVRDEQVMEHVRNAQGGTFVMVWASTLPKVQRAIEALRLVLQLGMAFPLDQLWLSTA